MQVLPAIPFLVSELPVDFFRKFFDNELCMWLVQQTNLYAAQNKTRNWQDINADELKAFIGILIAVGLHQEPSVEHF